MLNSQGSPSVITEETMKNNQGKQPKQRTEFYDQEEIEDQRNYENNSLAQLIKKEQLELIEKIVASSKSEECEFFHYLELHYIEGYSFREIAKKEGTYHEMVRSRMERALRYLKNKVRDYPTNSEVSET